MVMLVKLLQFWKAYLPIEVTEFGIVILVMPVQSMNAESPIEVTELGIATLFLTLSLFRNFSVDLPYKGL